MILLIVSVVIPRYPVHAKQVGQRRGNARLLTTRAGAGPRKQNDTKRLILVK
jgi:hypothetical protein